MSEKVLSVFIDESGDFGASAPHAPFYLVSMILHNQSFDIASAVKSLEENLQHLGYQDHAIHTGPLIRRESVYANDLMETRKHLFNVLFHFTRLLNINYLTAKIKKKECSDIIELTAKLSAAIAETKGAFSNLGQMSSVVTKLLRCAVACNFTSFDTVVWAPFFFPD